MLRRKPKQKSPSEISPIVPSGLIASTEKGDFYVKGSKRFKFVSDRARDSWGLPIVRTKELYLSNIKISGIIGFRDGTMIKDISNSKIYLISDNTKRHIVDPDVITILGYNDRILVVSQKEASFHKEGEILDAK